MEPARPNGVDHPHGLVPVEDKDVTRDDALLIQALQSVDKTLRDMKTDMRLFGAAILVAFILAIAVALDRDVSVTTPVGDVGVTSRSTPPSAP